MLIVASTLVPSENSTSTWPPSAACEITWLSVRMCPSERITSPDPVPAPVAPLALMVTTYGCTSPATFAT